MTFSISELKAKRARMTPLPWVGVGDDVSGDCDNASGPITVAVMDMESMHSHDAAGIADTHNAADVLIEIAEAALALQSAKKGAAAAQFAWYRAIRDPDEGARYESLDLAQRLIVRRQDEFNAALAKVNP